MRFENRAAIITGAASGMGLVASQELAKEGVKGDKDTGDSVRKELPKQDASSDCDGNFTE